MGVLIYTMGFRCYKCKYTIPSNVPVQSFDPEKDKLFCSNCQTWMDPVVLNKQIDIKYDDMVFADREGLIEAMRRPVYVCLFDA